MFEYIKGEITEKGESYIVLENSSVGYKIFCSSTDVKMELGQKLKVYIYEHIREDGWDLYGFSSKISRKMFEKLLSIPKIGPKLAMTILSTYNMQDLISYIKAENILALNKVSGVGKKTAERIILELKDKVADLFIELGINVADLPEETKEVQIPYLEDVKQALVNLGFTQSEINKKLDLIKREQPEFLETASLDELVGYLLSLFYKEN
jgi:Holliday junction DNA helicase RuvA